MDVSEKIARGVDLITEVAFQSGWESALGEVQVKIKELKERVGMMVTLQDYTELENEIIEMLKGDEKKIKREPVKSSDIKSIGYDSKSKVLEIEFSPERIYQYSDFPAEIHSNLMAASSKGGYFHAFIKGKYQFKQIKGDKK